MPESRDVKASKFWDQLGQMITNLGDRELMILSENGDQISIEQLYYPSKEDDAPFLIETNDETR